MSAVLDNIDVFVSGFWVTLQLCILSAIGALLIGTVMAVFRISPVPPLRAVGTGYVTVFRNVPLTIVFFFSAFGLPALGSNANFLRVPGLDQIFTRLGIDLPYFRFAIIALSLYTGAFVCEALRSGVNAVPVGQAEAARAIGLPFAGVMANVVLPQALRAALPPLASTMIALLKNTTVAISVLVLEAAFAMRQLLNDNPADRWVLLLTFAAIFVVLVEVVSLFSNRLERRWKSAR